MRKKIIHFITNLFEFTKMTQIALTVAVLFYTDKLLDLASIAVTNGYSGSLAWLTALTTGLWGAYGTIISFAINKAKSENIHKNPDVVEIQSPESAKD